MGAMQVREFEDFTHNLLKVRAEHRIVDLNRRSGGGAVSAIFSSLRVAHQKIQENPTSI
jgi:hypothetical protein